MKKRWRRKPPDKDGWWLFREDGFYEQRILIVSGVVADDYEFEDAGGTDGNFWEGNDPAEMTFGPLTSGVWMFDSPISVLTGG